MRPDVRSAYALFVLLIICSATGADGAGGKTPPPPLPPSAVLFDGDYRFPTGSEAFNASVNIPAGGAWLVGTATWNHRSFPGWDCEHSYSAVLSPNANDYAPLFIAGWTSQGLCSDQPPVFGCFNCGIDWGGVKAYPGLYMTTNNTPGFMSPGTGIVAIRSNNGGGQADVLTLNVQQVNRDAMSNLTMFQSVSENDPTPASDTDVKARTFIADTLDRVPVVPVFHHGTDASGADVQFSGGTRRSICGDMGWRRDDVEPRDPVRTAGATREYDSCSTDPGSEDGQS